METPIQEVARHAGVTSRTLRHYDEVGLLHPSSTASGGRRYYDEAALRRLQRILLLRDLGLGIPAISDVLAGTVDDITALERHIELLRAEQQRIAERIAALTATIAAHEKGTTIMAEQMFEGFDHAQYEEEVRERWGDEAWRSGDEWWSRLSEQDRRGFMREHADIQDAYDAAIAAGSAAEDPQVQAIAARHVAWISAGWQGRTPGGEAIRGLADMYVADPRFAKNYTRAYAHGAEFVRDALHAYAARASG